jgi:hypothetical protein
MSTLIILLLSILIVLLLAVAVLRGDRRHAAQAAALALAASGFLFLIRLPLPALATLLIAVIGFARAARERRSRRSRSRKPWSRAAPQSRRSTVRTQVLEMTLDPDSGQIGGRVLSGPHAGKTLESLSVAELLEVAGALGETDTKSLNLLSTYLDRVHPGWSETTEDKSLHDAASLNAGSMTRDQAYEVLGLKPGATVNEIIEAHRRLIKRMHPDAGGSAALAAHINAAKARLM